MSSQQSIMDSGRTPLRVTISDVADALGLTKSTVSRALNNYPDISAATQLRVKRMAEKLNYQPLSYAQAVKTGRTRSLGFVLQLADHDAQRPFLAEFLAGLSAGASMDGYTLTVASADSAEHLIHTFRSLLRDGKADGFVLPRAMISDPRVALLREAGVPFVLYGRQSDPQDCCWFDIRGEDAMRDAVLRLAELGHRRIAFVNGGAIYAYSTWRLEGFLNGMASVGLAVEPDMMIGDAVTLADGEAATDRLLALPEPPSAIVCAVDQVALGVYQAASRHGRQIGQDLSVIGYDGVRDGARAQPPLTTYAVDNRDAGIRLAQLLIRRIRGEDPKNLRQTGAARFVEGGSIGPAPAT